MKNVELIHSNSLIQMVTLGFIMIYLNSEIWIKIETGLFIAIPGLYGAKIVKCVLVLFPQSLKTKKNKPHDK